MSGLSSFLSELAKLPLAGVLVGGFIGVASSLIVPVLNRRAERKSLRTALASEMWALLEIVEARQYIPGLERQIDAARESPVEQQEGFRFYFSARADYFAVYHANLDKIGLLKPSVVASVVEFYCIAASILEDIADMREGEEMNRDESIERLEALLLEFQEITAFGKEVIVKLNRKVMKSSLMKKCRTLS